MRVLNVGSLPESNINKRDKEKEFREKELREKEKAEKELIKQKNAEAEKKNSLQNFNVGMSSNNNNKAQQAPLKVSPAGGEKKFFGQGPASDKKTDKIQIDIKKVCYKFVIFIHFSSGKFPETNKSSGGFGRRRRPIFQGGCCPLKRQ